MNFNGEREIIYVKTAGLFLSFVFLIIFASFGIVAMMVFGYIVIILYFKNPLFIVPIISIVIIGIILKSQTRR